MRKKHLSQSEMNTLLEHLKPSTDAFDLIIELSAYTGMRCTELWSIKLDDLVYSTGELRLWQGAKGSNGRLLALPRAFVEKLKRIGVFACLPNERLIVALGYQSRGGTEKSFKSRLRFKWGVLKADLFGSSLKLGLHALRHTFCIHYFESCNKDLIATKHAMGHKNVNNTLEYLEQVNESEHLNTLRSLYDDVG